MKTLSDKLLLESFQLAVEMELDQRFIALLREEIKKRKLHHKFNRVSGLLKSDFTVMEKDLNPAMYYSRAQKHKASM